MSTLRSIRRIDHKQFIRFLTFMLLSSWIVVAGLLGYGTPEGHGESTQATPVLPPQDFHIYLPLVFKNYVPSYLKNILVVAVHPYNEPLESIREKWADIFHAYHIQFLDRGTGLNDVNYKEEFDARNVAFSHDNNIYIASYFIMIPMELSPEWSFTNRYYASLPDEKKWKTPDGALASDPYESSGGRDIYGNIFHTEGGVRTLMSLCSPYWYAYQIESIDYALDHGLDAIDIDCPQVVPFIHGGDFCGWCLSLFNEYLEERHSPEELAQWGIENLSTFNIRDYILNKYVAEATEYRDEDGHPWFNTNPLDKPLYDPIVQEFVKFNYYILINFYPPLSDHAKERGAKRGIYVPLYGNLHMGHPPSVLSMANPSVVLGRSMDVIQIESIPAVPPGGRTMTLYRLGWAMGDYEKPVWGLHQPFYGHEYEPEIPPVTFDPLVTLLRLYLAEAYANGVIPEIDLGGWPGVAGPRGLFLDSDGRVIEELIQYIDFVWRNQEYFIGAVPESEVGLIYSIPTFMWHDQPLWGIWYGDERDAFAGYARALEEAHVPYDVLIFGHPDIWDDSVTLSKLSKYRIVVLPLTDCISDAQLQALETYVRNGGILIVIGDENSVAIRDEDYHVRPSSGLSNLLDDPGRGKIISVSEDLVCDFYQLRALEGKEASTEFTQILSSLPTEANQLQSNAPRDVGISVLRQGARLIVHLVNYAYDINTDTIAPQGNIELSIRVPEPSLVNEVTLISPDMTGSQSLMYTQDGDFLSVVVPSLGVWAVVVIQ